MITNLRSKSRSGSGSKSSRRTVYQGLLVVVRALQPYLRQWPRGWGHLIDQCQRALSSAVLNLVEGNTRRSTPERRRFFECARGSVAEVCGVLDLAEAVGLMAVSTVAGFKSQLRYMANVLRKL